MAANEQVWSVLSSGELAGGGALQNANVVVPRPRRGGPDSFAARIISAVPPLMVKRS